MAYSGKSKSFIMSFAWVGLILMAMGIVFISVAVITHLAPIEPGQVSVYYNDVRQPDTPETVESFKRVFNWSFGGIGIALMAISMGIFSRKYFINMRNRRLMEEGVCVVAGVTGLTAGNVRVNNVPVRCLQCSYTDGDGTTFIFKSGALRMDPTSYLPDGQIKVYYDPNNMKRYFVDVDGGIGLGTRVVEL